MCFVDRVINLLQWMRVHIYSLDSLAGYGTQNLLEKKYQNKLIPRYIDSNFLSIESLLMKPLADPFVRTLYTCQLPRSFFI